MDNGTILGVYGIFFLFAIIAFMKHLLTNSSSLTRFLRVYVMQVAFVFISYSIASLIYLISFRTSDNNLNIVIIVSYVVFTLLVIGSLVKFDNVKEKSRDEWKYTAVYFEPFSTEESPRPKNRIYDFIIGSIKLFFVFLTVGLLIATIVLGRGEIVVVVLSSLLIALVLIFTIWNIKVVDKLFRENKRYNSLKRKLINGEIKNINSDTSREVGEKLIELYDFLFLRSVFYRNNCETNDAILKEIGARCGVHPSKYWHLLSENKRKKC